MAGNQNAKNPLPAAEALPLVLQPVNVQLNELAKRLDALVQVTQRASAGTAQATSSLQQSQNTMMAILGQVKTGVTAALATAANSVTQLVGTVQGAMGQFVSAFRPDVMERFQVVVNDMLAVIGEVMVPIMQAATQMFRWLADTMAGVATVVLPMVRAGLEAVKPIIEALGNTLKGAINFEVIEAQFKQFMAIIDALKEPILTLLPVILQVVQVIQSIQVTIVGVVTSVIKSIAPLLSAIAGIIAPLIQIFMVPLQILGAVIGPMIQTYMMPFMIGFQLLGGVLKASGAILAAVTSVIQPFVQVIDMIGKTFSDVMTLFTDLFQDAIGLIGELLQPLREFFSDTVKYVVDALNQVVTKIKEWVNEIREFFGLELLGGRRTSEASSVGKGSTQAAFTSTDELWKKLVAGSFGAGRGMAEDHPAMTATATNGIWDWIKANEVEVKAAMAAITRFTGATGDAVSSAGRMVGGPALEHMIKGIWTAGNLRGG